MVAKMWKTICDKYEGKTHIVSIDICRHMMVLRAEDGNNICTYLDNMHHMYKQLAGMNTVPSLDDYMTIILGSFPMTYSNHLCSLSATAQLNNKPLTPHYFKSYVIELYDLCKLQPETSAKSSKDMALCTKEKSG